MKKHIITLGGLPGSGKSSTGKVLAKKLGYERFSSGDFFREMAQKRGISVEEINLHAEGDSSIDHETDEWVRQKASLNNIVIDSRMAFHWIPDAFKVFLKLDLHTAAERMFDQMKTEGRVGQAAQSVEESYHKMVARVESERKRYEAFYGVDYTDETKYDLVVDTGPHNLESVTKTIADAYQKWLES